MINLENFSPKEKEILEEIIVVLKKIEPEFHRLDNQLEFLEESSLKEFEDKAREIKESLIYDESISDEDLEKVYIEKLKEAKEEIFSNAKQRLLEIEKGIKEEI
ncbi:hypothetical protein SDC9_07976 [bioreactor metagenome]|uniref:Uncharacterized protein n=1 Tax=bioreactor metagenome TaxID=1076179 RepID=A0A644T5Y7_9ZZZZ|nr:hypothetical protein [Candidatus Elulimicrobiales bacterium]